MTDQTLEVLTQEQLVEKQTQLYCNKLFLSMKKWHEDNGMSPQWVTHYIYQTGRKYFKVIRTEEPFTSKNGSDFRASASHSYIHTWSLSSGETMLNSVMYDNTAVVSLGESDVNGAEAWTALTTSQVNNASEINTSVNYRVA
mgnify:CR=1 FL=1